MHLAGFPPDHPSSEDGRDPDESDGPDVLVSRENEGDRSQKNPSSVVLVVRAGVANGEGEDRRKR
jgi:hypothetical protein